jgi:ribonuclease HI
MAKSKFYVVWQGLEPGIYLSWEECRQQVNGVKGARYKSFGSRAEAERAFAEQPVCRVDASAAVASPSAATSSKRAAKARKPRPQAASLQNPPDYRHDTVLPLPPEVCADALAVDAACSGNPGPMEYRGVDLTTGAEVFHYGPVRGTNNIGEFLAIVHALALFEQQGIKRTIYSDSRNAMLWVKARKCRTTLTRNARTEQLYQLIERAENWLRTHDYADIPILKWDTPRWGEIPADFGRK